MSRRIALFAVGSMLVLLAAWFLLLWSPKGGELDKARQRRAAAEQQVDALQLKFDRLKDARKREPQLLAARDRLKSAVPEKADLAGFILDANAAAQQAGVDFMSITPTPPAQSPLAGSPPIVAVQVTANGGYFPMMDFLQRLLDLPRLVVIDGIQLRPGGSDGKQLSADLSGRLLTMQAPAAVAGAAAANAAATSASTTTTTVAK